MIIDGNIRDLGDLPYARITRDAKNLSRVGSCALNCPNDGVLTTARAYNQYLAHSLLPNRSVLTQIALTHFRHSYIPVNHIAASQAEILFTLIGGKPKSVY
jgi:hypothetical protein